MQRARDDEPDLVLLEHVARAVAHAGLRPRVRGAVEAERVLVVERRLLRVADPQLDVIPAVERHEVFSHQRGFYCGRAAGAAAAASAGEISSSVRRSGCSLTQMTAITQTASETNAAARNAGWIASASACARRERQPVDRRRPRRRADAGRQAVVDDHAHDRDAERRADLPRELRQRGRRADRARAARRSGPRARTPASSSRCPIPAITMLRAASPFVVCTFIRQSSTIPTVEHERPEDHVPAVAARCARRAGPERNDVVDRAEHQRRQHDAGRGRRRADHALHEERHVRDRPEHRHPDERHARDARRRRSGCAGSRTAGSARARAARRARRRRAGRAAATSAPSTCALAHGYSLAAPDEPEQQRADPGREQRRRRASRSSARCAARAAASSPR